MRCPRARATGVAALLALSPPTSAAQVPARRAPAAPATSVARHSPLFGLGPQTIYRGGWGIEIAGEWERHDGAIESERGLHAEIHYGVTEDLTIGLSVPLVQKSERTGMAPGIDQVARDATGVGDVLVRTKFRFWQDLFPNGNHQATVFAGAKLPTGRTSTEPPLGSGSTDLLAGAAVSRETQWYYVWASALARLNTRGTGDVRRGDELRYDAAVGVRPYVPEWTAPDLMLLVELVGVTAGRTSGPGGDDANTGGTVLALAPGLWLTYRNWALKAGVKLPVHQRLNGTQPALDFQSVFALEYHFGG